MRVAVVEDELLSRKKILSYLEMFEKESGIPIQVETLTDGTEIVEKYNTGKKYDVILLDIEMEHMDGMKAAEWIRNFASAAAAKRCGRGVPAQYKCGKPA